MSRPVFDMLVLPHRRGWEGIADLDYLFKGITERAASVETAEGWIREMDRHGIDRGLLCMASDEDYDWVRDMTQRYPERFVPAQVVSPSRGMEAVRQITRAHGELGVQVLRVGPWREQQPPTHRSYWPVYAKAVELNMAIQINVGIPGPQVPGWVQDPIYVDEVCYEFPELTVMMTHVGFPWTGTVIRNLERWPNCHLVLNSYAPKQWPSDIVAYIRRTSGHKVMYGTEFPLLSWDRTLRQIDQLGFTEETLDDLLYGNAHRLLGLAVAAGAGQ